MTYENTLEIIWVDFLGMHKAISPLPQYVFTAWCLVKHRVTLPLPHLYLDGLNRHPGLNVMYIESQGSQGQLLV
jgi:hypothetical protein